MKDLTYLAIATVVAQLLLVALELFDYYLLTTLKIRTIQQLK